MGALGVPVTFPLCVGVGYSKPSISADRVCPTAAGY